MAKRISAEQFLDLAKEKFENKIEYNREDFKNMRSKINVFCSSRDHFGVPHGWFATSAEVHLRGDGGCKTCQYSKGEYLCRNKDDFVYWGNKFHKGKYDYSEFIYVDGKTKGLIKCDIDGHKPFLMHPNNHLSRKAGCPECGKTQAGANLSKNRHGGVSLTQRLLNEGPKIHKKKFDYSLINPDKELRIKDFVQVICPRHGAFEVQFCSPCWTRLLKMYTEKAAKKGGEIRKNLLMSARKDGDIRTNTIQKLITLVVYTQLHLFAQSTETLNATRPNLID